MFFPVSYFGLEKLTKRLEAQIFFFLLQSDLAILIEKPFIREARICEINEAKHTLMKRRSILEQQTLSLSIHQHH